MLGINSSALPLHNQSKKTSESEFYSLNEETAPTLPLPTGGYSLFVTCFFLLPLNGN